MFLSTFPSSFTSFHLVPIFVGHVILISGEIIIRMIVIPGLLRRGVEFPPFLSLSSWILSERTVPLKTRGTSDVISRPFTIYVKEMQYYCIYVGTNETIASLIRSLCFSGACSSELRRRISTWSASSARHAARPWRTSAITTSTINCTATFMRSSSPGKMHRLVLYPSLYHRKLCTQCAMRHY